MFGYIKPFKPQLRFCEYDAYKAVYCGLCGQLGRSFGPIARLTLSYDFVFYCMLAYAMKQDERPHIELRRCCVNPLHKVPMADPDEVLAQGADLASIMIYYKLQDNMRDDGFWKRCFWRVLRPFATGAFKKARARRPEFDEMVARSMRAQQALEDERCESVDAACEPTARVMGELCAALSDEPEKRRVLKRLGYLVGRYVYLCDALDDLQDDLKSGSYNPFVLRWKLKEPGAPSLEELRERQRETLYLTTAEAGKAFALLDIEIFAPILENILLQGLRAGVDYLLAGKPKQPKPAR